VIRLVQNDLERVGTEVMKAGAIGTDNIHALKSFLQGEQFRRKLKFEEAISSYLEALKQDSAYALACYRLIGASGWVPNLRIDTKWYPLKKACG